MQRLFYSFLLLSVLLLCSHTKADDDDDEEITTEVPSKCEYNEQLVGDECIDSCYVHKFCGENTTCSSSFQTYCSCKRGYTGDPLGGCFKMDEKCPCSPNPCGPNSECIESDPEIGPHCRCKKDFYDWPPNCRPGCKNDDECGATEICNRFNTCEELCDPTRCGDNSVCRVDKKKKTMHCSCKDGFVPETKTGCRPWATSDDDIPADFFAEVLNDKCNGECGYNAYCGPEDKCVCTTDYVGDPYKECAVIQPARSGPCNPNPCGGLSECTVVNNEVECLCKEGFGTPPYCSKCNSKLDCLPDQICADGGRCVADVCKGFCGENVSCNIFEGKLECNCKVQPVNTHSMPFLSCPDVGFISAAAIAVLSG
ncbi:unnamed protein product [Chironomus riparius]|uniref:EGF-like domain-containing protein n=1 Tax=Chironomus riparius TaxID=315576 RepID=A0A9N9S0N0_9DIPT|nr:unnamed protein product [Chironomus riparius]